MIVPGIEWYAALILAGILLLGAELIIPGGILGVFGGLLLFAAVVTGFVIFETPYDILSAIVIIVGSFLAFIIWMRILPHTRIGKSLTLSSDTHTYKATRDHHDLLDKTGVAETDLRPAGIASIEGVRIDVVSENEWIEKDSTVKVVAVEGNRIAVRQVEIDA